MYIKRHLETAFKEANDFPGVAGDWTAPGRQDYVLRRAGPGGTCPSGSYRRSDSGKEDPRLFLANHPPPVIIDEIQYAPELLPYIKAMIDEARIQNPERQWMFWLTGSQQFQMMKGVTESLAGRIGIQSLVSNREIAGA